MAQKSTEVKATRKHSPSIRVHCLPEEKAKIEALAKQCRLSASTYLRNLGTGYQPKSTLDAQAMIELAKASGDLGRLGGLLKMFLTDDKRLQLSGRDQTVSFIHRLLSDIDTAKDVLLAVARKL